MSLLSSSISHPALYRSPFFSFRFCLFVSLSDVIYTSTGKATSDSHEGYREPIFRKPAPNPKKRDIYRAGLKYKVPWIKEEALHDRTARSVRSPPGLAHENHVPIFYETIVDSLLSLPPHVLPPHPAAP